MEKSRQARYTNEFKLEALRMVGAGQSIAAVAAILGISSKTLYNWSKAQQAGWLSGAGVRASPEQMELARLRAELSKTKMELAIVKKLQRTCAGVGMKYAWIDRNRLGWQVSMMCEQLEVSSSGYHQYVRRKERPQGALWSRRVSR